FISQALYEGGWAMDTSSPPEQQWWFYWPGDWSEPIRCSDSWVFAGDYAEGGGLGYTVKYNPPGSAAPNGACPGRADLYWVELKLGDLALVHKQEDPDTHHMGVVVAFDPDHGTPAPFPLVDAHSNNRYHYPLDWNGAFSLQQIDVLLLRYPSSSPLTLTATPAAFTFSCTRSQTNPPPQTLEVWNTGTGTLNWTASEGVAWLSLDPTSGSSTGEHDLVTLSVDAASLSTGTYTATITLAAIGAGNSPQQVQVNLTVQEPLPRIGYSPAGLTFSCIQGQGNPIPRNLDVWNAGGGSLNWTASEGAGWLSLTPTSGSSTGEHDPIALSVDASALSAGTYTATITLAAVGADNSPQSVGVTLVVSDSATHTVTYSLQPNWNMISLPLVLTSTDPQVVFGGLPSPWYLFEWDPLGGTYIGKELISLDLGAGYWLKVPTAVAYPVSGQPNGVAQTGIDLGLGWNLIGVPYQGTIPWGAVRASKDDGTLVTLDVATASNWIQGMFFHWNGSAYEMLAAGDSFQSLFGYWVKAKVSEVRLVFLQP
ncbi:MAG: amidase domain-containing protein, partial [Coprothermobacterota bacterium]|nr:amidase domain-containing protein [Coprothermobacterota bacterium]